MNREISLEELKKIQIEILDEVHSYCEQKGLVYFLSSGTLIGAIRHKGYIPWDDDIDIYMPRPDYEKFVSTFNESAYKYRVISLSTDKSCSFAYAKVDGNLNYRTSGPSDGNRRKHRCIPSGWRSR